MKPQTILRDETSRSIGLRESSDEELKENALPEKRFLLVDDQHYNLDALRIIISSVKKKDVSNLC
jgi:hypothetical protein